MAPPTKETTTSDGKRDVFRLTDMIVEEVSLVDRAANGRRFALVKRETDEMKTCPKCGVEVSSDITACAKCGAAIAKSDTGTGADEARIARVKSLAMAPEPRAKAIATLEKAAAGLVELAKDLKDAPVSDAVSASTLAGELMKVFGEVSGIDGVEKALVAKGTALVTASRIKSAKSASDAIAALVTELEASAADGAGAPAAAVAAAETAKAELAKRDTDLAAANERVAKAEADAKAKADELATLRKSLPASNAAPVDGAPPAGAAGEEKTSWGLDLNRPNDRKTTNPAHWMGK
jgi:hypothetical protein